MPSIKEPAWLTTMADQRLALLVEGGALASAEVVVANIVMTTLTEPDPSQSIERWERTCDRCGTYVPPNADPPFYTGTLSRESGGFRIYMAFGLCSVCKDVT